MIKINLMKTVYFILSLLMIGMISHSLQEYPMLVGCICFGIGIGYMREKNSSQSKSMS
jgi:1,4-dihydroxy-2-naphthoate octaprenyltransferase